MFSEDTLTAWEKENPLLFKSICRGGETGEQEQYFQLNL